MVEYDSHPGNDQLIKIGEDALPKMNPNGLNYVFHTILQVLEKSAEISENFDEFLMATWQSVLVAMHSDKFSSMNHICLPLLKISMKKIFEKSKTKTGLILPLVERL